MSGGRVAQLAARRVVVPKGAGSIPASPSCGWTTTPTTFFPASFVASPVGKVRGCSPHVRPCDVDSGGAVC